MVALIALQFFISNYQPLVRGNTFSVPPGARTVDTMGDYPEPETIARIGLQPGQLVAFGFSIVNDGPLPITIEEIAPPRIIGLDPTDIEISPSDWNTSPNAEPISFSPTTIGVGEQRVVGMSFIGADCAVDKSSGAISSADTVVVRYSTLWSTRTAEFPLPVRLAVNDVGGNCRSSSAP